MTEGRKGCQGRQEGREGGRVEVKYDRRKEVTPVKKRRKDGRDEG